LTADTLAVADDRGRASTLAVSDLSALDVSTPTNQALRYALMGSLVGGGICVGTVAIVDMATVKATSDVLGVESEEGQADASAYVTAALIGVGLGAIIGAMMGAKKPGPERWKPINAMVGISMREDIGTTASLAIRF
jgi:hypothetical protein